MQDRVGRVDLAARSPLRRRSVAPGELRELFTRTAAERLVAVRAGLHPGTERRPFHGVACVRGFRRSGGLLRLCKALAAIEMDGRAPSRAGLADKTVRRLRRPTTGAR